MVFNLRIGNNVGGGRSCRQGKVARFHLWAPQISIVICTKVVKCDYHIKDAADAAAAAAATADDDKDDDDDDDNNNYQLNLFLSQHLYFFLNHLLTTATTTSTTTATTMTTTTTTTTMKTTKPSQPSCGGIYPGVGIDIAVGSPPSTLNVKCVTQRN